METSILFGILLLIACRNIRTLENVTFDIPDPVPLSLLMANLDESAETKDCQFLMHSTRVMMTSSQSEMDFNLIPNAVDLVRFELLNNLDLPYLQYNILQAKGVRQGILFEMATPEDARVVLQQFEYLSHNEVPLKFKFETETQLDIYEMSDVPLIDVRSGFSGVDKTEEGAIY